MKRWHITFKEVDDAIFISLASYSLDDVLAKAHSDDRVFRRPLFFGMARMRRRIERAYV